MADQIAAPHVTPTSFAVSLLHQLGDPTTPDNVSSIVGWENSEGGNWKNSAAFNPLNTTEDAPGATSMNSDGVKAYGNWQQGLKATDDTLNNGYYGDLLGAFKSGKGLTPGGYYSGLKTWSGNGYTSVTPAATAKGGQWIEPAGGTVAAPTANATSSNALSSAPSPQSYKLQKVQSVQPLNVKGAAANAFLQATLGQNSNPLNALVRNLTSGKYGGNTTTTVQRVPTPQVVATAKARIGTTAKPANGTEYQQVMNAAVNVANHHYNYEWGGGHNDSFAPTSGSGHGSGPGVGYDCSGVLSDIFHAAGLLNTPLVASQFAEAGKYIKGAKPGPGKGPQSITIYANAEHTFAHINGQYFGTSESQNPGGGAGFFKDADLAGYQVWHVDLGVPART